MGKQSTFNLQLSRNYQAMKQSKHFVGSIERLYKLFEKSAQQDF